MWPKRVVRFSSSAITTESARKKKMVPILASKLIVTKVGIQTSVKKSVDRPILNFLEQIFHIL